MIKKLIKKILLKRRNIFIDLKSSINYSVKYTGSDYPVNIVNSQIHINEISEGSFLENVFGYGNIKIGRFVSISGPGTILHAEKFSIQIGSFSSIAQNVSIQEFNHDYNKPTSSAINMSFFDSPFANDVVSNGDVVIEEDVWIGSNVSVLSGVRIGRGSVIGAGSVVTKNVPRYSIAFGNPAKFYKKRFSDEMIELLESLKWWDWDVKKIERNNIFFNLDINMESVDRIIEVIVE